MRKIVDSIYYTGVNDRVTDRFEALWPLPYGVSYNSYVVAGSAKVALLDTVEIDEVREFLSEVERGTEERGVDYLVVHHMEPDHSGSIPEVIRRWPEIRVVGNAQTVAMIKGFYKIDDDNRFLIDDDNRFLIVKDGDTLDLGGVSLKFYLTPMVHWPETMMSYVPERKILFSGDAFGCFGALNGAVVDSDMDTEMYWNEMYRYYSNIVGKYGKFVRKALDKLSGLNLDYICSTHGPVWHDHVSKVVDIYGSLSEYGSEPGVTIIYGSMYGNTAEVAEEIARGLAESGVKKIRIHNASHSNMSDMISDAFRYKGLVIGSSTYSMTLLPPIKTFVDAMITREIKGKVFAAFGGYTWAANPVKQAFEAFSETTGMPLAGYVSVKQSLDDATRAAARELGRKLASEL